MESLNIQVLSGSSVKENLFSNSSPLLLLREWETGTRRRLFLLSCTRVFSALESRTVVCCKNKQSLYFQAAENEAASTTISNLLDLINLLSLIKLHIFP